MFKDQDNSLVCINLKYRRDRAIEMKRQLGDIPFTFVDACEPKDHPIPELSKKSKEKNGNGIYCCATSHVEVIRRAQKYGCSYLTILEDDAILCDDFLERIKIIEDSEIDFDMCYIGGHFAKEKEDIEKTDIPHLWKAFNIGGTYGYIIKCQSEAADFLIRNWNYDYGIDEFYCDHIQTRFNCYAFLPFLVGHNSGYSDVNGWVVYADYNQYFQKEKL